MADIEKLTCWLDTSGYACVAKAGISVQFCPFPFAAMNLRRMRPIGFILAFFGEIRENSAALVTSECPGNGSRHHAAFTKVDKARHEATRE